MSKDELFDILSEKHFKKLQAKYPQMALELSSHFKLVAEADRRARKDVIRILKAVDEKECSINVWSSIIDSIDILEGDITTEQEGEG